MAHWILQDNLNTEQGYEKLIDQLQRQKIDFSMVQVVPFSHELNELIGTPIKEIEESEKPIVAIGSISLGEVAVDRGWKPGIWHDDAIFNVRSWPYFFGKNDDLLNPAPYIRMFHEIGDVWTKTFNPNEELFIRPCLDNKSFSGTVMTSEEFYTWQKQIVSLYEEEAISREDRLHPFIEIALSPVRRDIKGEYRFAVVGGKIITGSQYKRGRTVLRGSYSEMNDIDDDISYFAACAADRAYKQSYYKIPACVIDIADTSDGPKVIEMGTINSCGFYGMDMGKFVAALNDLAGE